MQTRYDPMMKEILNHFEAIRESKTLTRPAGHFSASIYPNPVDASPVVTFYTDKPDELTIQLADMHGRILFTDDWLVSKGDNEVSLSRFTKLVKGHYVLRLYGSATGYTKTISILKR